MKQIIAISALTACFFSTHGHANPESQDVELVVQAGLIQPLLLKGGNVEIDLVYKRFVIGYSHGFNLNLEGGLIVGQASDQGLAYRLPFSTGIGVGYKLLDWLDLRGELKWHRFDVSYDDSRDIEGGDLFSYDTVTLGAGLYAHWRPFDESKGWMRGLNVSTSVRYWPKLATSLDGDIREYGNSFVGTRVTHTASEIGIANTPFIFNVSVGYAFVL